MWLLPGGLAIVCLVFGIVCLVLYVRAKSARVPVQATVDEIKQREGKDKKGKKQYIAVVRYQVGDNEMTAEAQYPMATGEYRVGQKVNVYYDKKDAQKIYFEADMYSLVAPMVMLVVGIALAAWSVWLFMRLA